MADQGKLSLKEEVLKWLEKEGVPLELRVAKAFREAGFRTSHSMYYEDPNTGESRETDVVASRQLGQNGHWIRLVFVIECKNIREKPWVGFAESHVSPNDNQRIKQRMAMGHGRILLDQICTRKALFNKGLFGLPDRCVSTVTTAFRKNNEDVSYNAIQSILSASLGITKRFHKSVIAAIVFPIVLVEGNLFVSQLTDSGDLTVEDVDDLALLWKYPGLGQQHAIINIVNLKMLSTLVQRCNEATDAIFGIDQDLRASILGQSGNEVKSDDPSLDF